MNISTWANRRLCTLAVGGALLLVHLLFCSIAATGAADSLSTHTALAKTIVSLDKTRTAVFEHHFMAAGTSASAASREEALLFLAYLDGRIDHYCRTLYQSGGAQSLAGLPCPRVGPGQEGDPRFAVVPDSSGQTSAEQLAGMEEELTAALGEFDEMLLKEQEKVAAHIPRQRESSSGDQGEQPAGEASEAAAEDGSGAEERSPADREGDSAAEQRGGAQEQTASSEGAGQGRTQTSREDSTRRPGELDEDDDVVARQLREAAEQETDPEVKEKLWEEYHKYKEGTK